MIAGACRLPPPAGLLIDRDRPVRFSFEGVSYEGFAGDTLASALAANGRWLLSRSFKYHRPRGLLTAAGHDGNTLVQLDGAPNIPADRLAITDGLAAWGQHYRGSLERDRDRILEALARFMPVGFYYRAFFRPRGIWDRFWEPKVRSRAGLGRVSPDAVRSQPSDKQHAFCDLAVIGAGVAGLAAARVAAEAGAEVLLIDDQACLGGSCVFTRHDAAGSALRMRLVEAVRAEPRIAVWTEAICTGWYADHWLAVIRDERLFKVRARQVVFATGCVEQPMVFRNNDLPGIVVGSAAQRLIRLYGVRPGGRAVVLAGNDAAYGVALDLADSDVTIAAIAELRQADADGPLAAEARARGLPVRTVARVDEALADRTGMRVGAVVLDGARIACDLVCMAAAHSPAYQLPAQAGARVGYDHGAATFVVEGPGNGIGIAGGLNGMHAPEHAAADGERAGIAAALALGLAVRPAVAAIPDQPPAPSAPLWPIYPHPRGKEFVDFDEDLQIADIVNAVREGYRHIELVKRFSTVGMGPSQGRTAALNTARIVARETGASLAEIGITTARPPAFGEPLAALAGQPFHPERLTPMHQRHLELGAQMTAVGAWWRPAYYGPAADRGAAVDAEVAAIRDRVGLIDVSTLGKLEVRGPDAAAFLDRLYTSSYVKQPVGRIRYALMLNEAGTVIDDGVAARLAAEHFYLTATTGAVDSTFRQMLWWNAQWRLKVDVTNMTVGFAAVNLAGPCARDVLAALAPDIDLSAEAFPYLTVVRGAIGGIPARLLRVGFVGELGYEIHVPNQMGEALWDRLIDAGEPFGIRPVGLEAQRVLRLEKGHIIVGQDTDGLTTPTEIGMDWAVARAKPFFVGARSHAIREKQAPKRRLTGFALPLDGPVPEESCLVVSQGEMTGLVTSAARSRHCGQVIGLAYVRPDCAAPGTTITIRLADGSDVAATVVPLPFYDPDLARQKP